MSLNGKKVNNLLHLVQMVDGCKDAPFLDFALDYNQRVSRGSKEWGGEREGVCV